ncbi:hydroxyisourate hydrolase [Variovorax guangxiensis]|jgi:5-hydroxyisourate hydrolase|uniref:5-hydroxyisourate hydrolase n=1 Tax=Variovorax guangxiensis TaxID=1775474 RepID=A0A840FWN4_9BURK|nr:hydroxyisourate hydrolase [Variovorax guangxiensis]MBB4224714.1 5-hydroxyisourate hydrolase [Variovorax guangxiensis]
MTGISTHVLDITNGRPLAGLQVELYDMATTPPTRLNSTRTNADGRTDAPMLAAKDARTGHFELRFHVGDHFKAADGLSDVVPVRFSIFDAAQHYHVPMLCAPWFFSTYRGS